MDDGNALGDPDVEGTVVGIPAYNEANTIGGVVSESSNVAEEVLVVDDGSDDGTARIARSAGATVIRHDRNRGYGAALKAIFEEAARRSATHLVTLDGDAQHDPSDIPRLVGHLDRTGAGVVVGSRFVGSGATDAPLYRRFGLHLLNTLAVVALGRAGSSSPITDTQSGFRAYDRRVIRALAGRDRISDHMGASTDVLYLACQDGFSVEEVGTEISYDVETTSTENPVSHGTVLLKNVLRTIVFGP
jgi:glycosyltransferase involved in cell wall biosynthesis